MTDFRRRVLAVHNNVQSVLTVVVMSCGHSRVYLPKRMPLPGDSVHCFECASADRHPVLPLPN